MSKPKCVVSAAEFPGVWGYIFANHTSWIWITTIYVQHLVVITIKSECAFLI